ncbi:unnamed protein product [Allacma fusca]|uniref:CRAL-TRIO domain-containing protein n=1 Tax=Allacma fusca TaxID=39272 RepID=A0A8J2P1U6_9HEXA|nr:unnamed protein product [Allacma fusca]
MYKQQFFIRLFWCFLASSLVVVESAEETSIEELLKWEPPAELTERFPYYLSGVDNEGAQVWVVDFGKWDNRDIVDAGGQRFQDFKKYVQQMYTRAAYKNLKADPSKYSVVIMDWDGFTKEKASHIPGTLASIDMLRSFEKFARQGGFKRGFIVNANFLFETVWRLGKPVLGRLNELVEVFGTNPAKWTPNLLKLIPRDQLPEKFGGAKGHQYEKVFG